MMKKLYGLDKHGSHWHWNCGWHCLENSSVCLPHSVFRKSIKPNIVGWSDILKPKPRNYLPPGHTHFHPRQRPYDNWRRADEKLYSHFLYGDVILKETDGIHAIVVGNRELDGKIVRDIPVEVELANLDVIHHAPEPKERIKRPSKWGDLKDLIPTARRVAKEQGVLSPTDDQLRRVAQQLKDLTTNLFK